MEQSFLRNDDTREQTSQQIRRHEKQGRTPARRLIDSGDLRKEEQRKLENLLATLNPFAMRKEIRRLDDHLWSHRQALYKDEEREEILAPLNRTQPAPESIISRPGG